MNFLLGPTSQAQVILDYTFADKALLLAALQSRVIPPETQHGGRLSANWRLSHLGESVLRMVLTKMWYQGAVVAKGTF